jgi:hypothetical protein
MRKIVEIIQYLMLKIMKRSWHPDDNKPITAVSDHLLDKLIFSAFHVFNDSQFRKKANFENSSQAEQDRIFNELEVSSVCLCLFAIEQRESIIGNRDFHFWKEVGEYLPESLKLRLQGYGVDEENATLVKKLIKMRRDEYEKITDNLSDYIDSDEKFRDIRNRLSKDILARANSIAVGTVDHIRRGKLKKGDELIKYFHSWLIPLDLKITKFIKKL